VNTIPSLLASPNNNQNKMIRSRSIPTVLSRATGEGIHAVLLIDADGELLGSYGSPPPPPAPHEPDTGAGTPTPSTPTTIPSSSNGSMNNSRSDWPLDAASIGALISEVAGDYRRLGEELVLLDPASRRRNDKGDGSRQQDNLMVGESGSSGDDAGKEGGVSSSGKGEKKGSLDSGVNIKSLVIELEHVSSVDCDL
jgi:hypothetical protein